MKRIGGEIMFSYETKKETAKKKNPSKLSLPQTQHKVVQCRLNALPNQPKYQILNLLIRLFNQSLNTVKRSNASAQQKTVALKKAADFMSALFGNLTCIPEDPNLIQLRIELMQEIVDVAPTASPQRDDAFKTLWSAEFMHMNMYPTGADLLKELFLIRNAVNPTDRKTVRIQESSYLMEGSATGETSLRDASSVQTKYAPQAGSNSTVQLPALEYKVFYEAFTSGTNLFLTPMIMAAHEMMHALHYAKGASIPAKEIPFFVPATCDDGISVEELATTSVPNHRTTSTPTTADAVSSMFQPQYKTTMLNLYTINEQSLRSQANMPLLYAYRQKYNQSQVSDARQNITQPILDLFHELEFQENFLYSYVRTGILGSDTHLLRAKNFYNSATRIQKQAYNIFAFAIAGSDSKMRSHVHSLISYFNRPEVKTNSSGCLIQ